MSLHVYQSRNKREGYYIGCFYPNGHKDHGNVKRHRRVGKRVGWFITLRELSKK